MYLVNPIIKVVFLFRVIAWLRASPRKTVGPVERAGNVNEIELEHHNGDDPSI